MQIKCSNGMNGRTIFQDGRLFTLLFEAVEVIFLILLCVFFFFSSMHSDYKDLVDFIKIKLERTCFGQMST